MKPVLRTVNLRVQPLLTINLAAAKWVTLLLLASLFLMTGCKNETDVTPPGTVVAKAGPDQPVQVGQTVTLDGSASVDSDGKPVTYLWVVVRKPAKSTATLSDPTSFKPTFKADEVGEYEFELTATSPNGKSTDRVIVSASAAEPLAITANITVKTTLVDRIANPDLPDYIVTKSIDVTHELTVNSGVVIAFERDARMNISDGGGLLIAKGTAEQKIKLVGVQNTKGYWAGLTLYSGSNANTMEYVEVRNAGSRTAFSTTKAALFVAGSTKAQIGLKNCLFSQNDGYGIYVYEGGLIREFSQNAFTGNTEAGILLDALNVVKLDAASTFTGGNGHNVVEVTPSAITGKSEVVWAGFADKTPYRINGSFGIDAGFKLAPGVTMEMNRDAVIQINATGYLSAKGTPTQKIIFTSADNTVAYWRGIISYSPDVKNELENAEVNNAGSTSIVSGKKANIALWGNRATINVTKTHISGSGGYGVFVGFGSSINADLNTANTFEKNTQGNVLIDK
ncbi:right-handed parallel beta-helix repeat-containing protein [Fibrella sp. USSR17]